jgi:hypothetical protein
MRAERLRSTPHQLPCCVGCSARVPPSCCNFHSKALPLHAQAQHTPREPHRSILKLVIVATSSCHDLQGQNLLVASDWSHSGRAPLALRAAQLLLILQDVKPRMGRGLEDKQASCFNAVIHPHQAQLIHSG